jgi:phasin family protein
MTMPASANPMLDTYQDQLSASRQMAEAMFDGTDRFEQLMLETTRRACDEQLKFLQALAATRDPQGLAALQTAFFSQTPEQMLKTQQEMMRIAVQTQDEIRKAMTRQLGGFNGAQSQMAGTDATNGSPMFANMYKVWDQAFRNMAAMTSKAMETAGNGAQAAHAEAVEEEAGATPSKSTKRK